MKPLMLRLVLTLIGAALAGGLALRFARAGYWLVRDLLAADDYVSETELYAARAEAMRQEQER